jgi:hypothetical protein
MIPMMIMDQAQEHIITKSKVVLTSISTNHLTTRTCSSLGQQSNDLQPLKTQLIKKLQWQLAQVLMKSQKVTYLELQAQLQVKLWETLKT